MTASTETQPSLSGGSSVWNCPVDEKLMRALLDSVRGEGASSVFLCDALGQPRLMSSGHPSSPTPATPLVSEPVMLYGARVACISARGAERGNLRVAVRRAAASLEALWTAASEVDNLAGEIVHAYEELHLLYELGDILTSHTSAESVGRLILDRMLQALGAAIAELSLVEGDRVIRAGAGAEAGGADLAGPNRRIETELRSGGEGVGRLVLMRAAHQERFSSVEQKLLDAVGSLVANAMRNARLYEAVRRQAETLQERETYLRAVLDNVAEGVLTVDQQGRVMTNNPLAETLFGACPGGLVGQAIDLLFDGQEQAGSSQDLSVISPGAREAVARRSDGSLFSVDLTVGQMYVADQQMHILTVKDITSRKDAEKALRHQALHDGLTNLPNRTLLHERLQQAIRGNRRTGKSAALLIMDLDRFKEVNDTFGHQYGDSLLIETARRLQRVLRDSDTMARLGGDEFAVLLPNATLAEAQHVAQRLLQTLEEPLILGGYVVDVRGSLGIALCPDHGADPDTLLRQADVAMYIAKRGEQSIAIYDATGDRHSPERVALVAELRRAIEEDQLVLFYQPKLDYLTNTVTGVEALVRWVHPRRGLISSDGFIPLAEVTGLIRPLSNWVLKTAIAQCRRWHEQGFPVSVSINLSTRNLMDPELPRYVERLVAASNLPPHAIVLEVTESSLMADPAHATGLLNEFRALGVGISIDDFGTGYSSLARLKGIPATELKIDKSFVRDMATDGSDAAIVRSIIALGHDLGVSVVAEGVEDIATLDLLRLSGCDLAQGYYLSVPRPPEELSEWMRLFADSARSSPRKGEVHSVQFPRSGGPGDLSLPDRSADSNL